MIITFPLAYLLAPHILVPYLTSPFSFFTPRKMHSGHHHINRLLSSIGQNGLKIKCYYILHIKLNRRERALKECIGFFLEFSYGSESHNIFFAFSVLLKGLLKALSKQTCAPVYWVPQFVFLCFGCLICTGPGFDTGMQPCTAFESHWKPSGTENILMMLHFLQMASEKYWK